METRSKPRLVKRIGTDELVHSTGPGRRGNETLTETDENHARKQGIGCDY
jgi:hypothetical protein